ncbi:MAG: hypothetical protein EKK29_03080 [Hyphomicrobiales bacterium]|nr:MAG: hypothetical protein EKK29_03080 [Hyphomicrobiales bacterium]
MDFVLLRLSLSLLGHTVAAEERPQDLASDMRRCVGIDGQAAEQAPHVALAQLRGVLDQVL